MKKQLSVMMALAVLAIGIITSCKKDPDPNSNGQNNEQPSDTIPVVIDGIRFGDTTGMKITTYNTIMEFDDIWHPFVFDLNGGGVDDIKIETHYDGPLAIGEYQSLTLYCLNDHTELFGDNIEKEIYSHRDTTITTNSDWTIIVYNNTFSTCGKIEENDPVSTSTVFEVAANDFNDTFNVDDHFQSIEVRLFREDYSFEWLNDYNEDEQYVVRSENRYIYDCWNFPTDEEKYIGFKITINDKPRLGWLKIKLHSTWEGRVVNTELIETAIQK